MFEDFTYGIHTVVHKQVLESRQLCITQVQPQNDIVEVQNQESYQRQERLIDFLMKKRRRRIIAAWFQDLRTQALQVCRQAVAQTLNSPLVHRCIS